MIGGFVLGALILLVTAILTFSSGRLWRERVALVTDFPGSVQGLKIGAPVQFQGVTVGRVTEVSLVYLPADDRFRIPVYYEVWPSQVRILGEGNSLDPQAILKRLVEEKGLRARLESVSLVTGQYLISLSLHPNAPPVTSTEVVNGRLRIPATIATRDRLAEMLGNLQIDRLVQSFLETLEAVRDLVNSANVDGTLLRLDGLLSESTVFLSKLNREFEPLVARVGRTLDAMETLTHRSGDQLGALSTDLASASRNIAALASTLRTDLPGVIDTSQQTLKDVRSALQTINQLARESRSTREELDRLLSEVGRAARSLHVLADYLERHPEVLLRGKR